MKVSNTFWLRYVWGAHGGITPRGEGGIPMFVLHRGTFGLISFAGYSCRKYLLMKRARLLLVGSWRYANASVFAMIHYYVTNTCCQSLVINGEAYYVQYRLKVTWQSLESWDSQLETRKSRIWSRLEMSLWLVWFVESLIRQTSGCFCCALSRLPPKRPVFWVKTPGRRGELTGMSQARFRLPQDSALCRNISTAFCCSHFAAMMQKLVFTETKLTPRRNEDTSDGKLPSRRKKYSVPDDKDMSTTCYKCMCAARGAASCRCTQRWSTTSWPRGDSHKRSGMLVVPLRGQNLGWGL